MKRTVNLLITFVVVSSLLTTMAVGTVAAQPTESVSDWDDTSDDDWWDDDDENDCENEELGYDHHPTCIDTDSDIDIGTDDDADGVMTSDPPSADNDLSECRELGEEMAEWHNSRRGVGQLTHWHATAAYGDCVKENTGDKKDGWN